MQSSPVYIVENNSTRKYYIKSATGVNNKTTTTLTSYPTAEGTSMSDHAYREPYSITVSLISSELNSTRNFYYTEDNTNLEKTITSQEFKELLFKWKENFTRLTLQTRRFQYKNMIITDITWSDDDNTLGAFNPTITLSECRVATTYTEQLGPFDSYESQGTYGSEKYYGNSNGNDLGETAESTLGGAVAGAVVGGAIGGPVGALIGAGVGALYGWLKKKL